MDRDQEEKRKLGGRGRARRLSPSQSRDLSFSSSSSSSITHQPSSGSGEAQPPVPEINVLPEVIIEGVAALSTGAGTGAAQSEEKSYRGFPRRIPSWIRDIRPVQVTRPAAKDFTKIGSGGTPIELFVNYFKVEKAVTWNLYQYDVIIEPEIDHVGTRKSLLWQIKEKIGPYIFDGDRLLYSATHIGDGIQLQAVTREGEEIKINLNLTKKLQPGDPSLIQFFNIIMKKIQSAMKLEAVGRGFYSPANAIEVPSAGLTIWPGYILSVRNHDKDLLLCVEVTHKVLRTENIFDVIRSIRSGYTRADDGWKRLVEEELVGSIAITTYSNKTFKIGSILWEEKPTSSFERKGEIITFQEYFRVHHKVEINSLNQPLLQEALKSKDEAEGRKPAKFIPEICQQTGLSDKIRSNHSVMKNIGAILLPDPKARVKSTMQLREKMQNSNLVELNRRTGVATEGVPLMNELGYWGLGIAAHLSKCQGRVWKPENIIMAGDSTVSATVKADWTNNMRSKRMFESINLKKWVLIVPAREVENVGNFVTTMKNVSRPLGMILNDPMKTAVVQQAPSVTNYLKQIDSAMAEFRGGIQMLFIVLPNNKPELYGAVKKSLCVNYGVPSQCFVARNLTARGLMSIATKVVIQMNAKLGGIPWTIKIPLKKTMIVGFDVYHGVKGASDDTSIGALVSTTSEDFGSYFSIISTHRKSDEMSKQLCASMEKSLVAFRTRNGFLPEKVFLYRDGVGEGQLHIVIKSEVSALDNFLKDLYKREKAEWEPKLTFIVVTKRINTRIFKAGDQNPDPGTILDNTVTLPERYDFFMISQQARQGTVSPTSYNVLMDGSNLEPGRLQLLSYKLCHLYYNWSGTVSVPATCQYAHKLAYLTGLAIGSSANQTLANQLYFL